METSNLRGTLSGDIPQDRKMCTIFGLNPSQLPSKSSKGTARKQPSKKTVKSRKVPLDVHLPDKMVTINANLEPEEEKELLEFLRKNILILAKELEKFFLLFGL